MGTLRFFVVQDATGRERKRRNIQKKFTYLPKISIVHFGDFML